MNNIKIKPVTREDISICIATWYIKVAEGRNNG